MLIGYGSVDNKGLTVAAGALWCAAPATIEVTARTSLAWGEIRQIQIIIRIVFIIIVILYHDIFDLGVKTSGVH